MATRLNAMALIAALGKKAYQSVSEKVEDADLAGDRIYVMGGTVPGHTTDTVTALLASHVKADLIINATNVDGVYDRDPRKYTEARRFETLSSKKLIEIVQTKEYLAGASTVIDPKAARIIHEKGIKTIVIDGRKAENIVVAVNGRAKGTLITG